MTKCAFLGLDTGGLSDSGGGRFLRLDTTHTAWSALGKGADGQCSCAASYACSVSPLAFSVFFLQKEQSPSLHHPRAPSPSLQMRDMDTDQEPKAAAELPWNHVSSQNLRVSLAGSCV